MAKPTRYTPEVIEDYRKKGFWQSVTFSDLWKTNAGKYPHKKAVADSRISLTWAEADRWIDRLALSLLELGLKKDDMVAAQLPNGVEVCLVRVACERAGLLCTPIQRNFRHKEMEYILKYIEAKAVVIPLRIRDFCYLDMIRELQPALPSLKQVILTGDEAGEDTISFNAMAKEVMERRYPRGYLENTKCPADEFSLVLPTTGTTGFPKLVEHPICCALYMGGEYLKRFGLTPEDIIGVFGPAPEGPNAVAYLGAPLMGIPIIMEERFEAGEALRLIQDEHITFIGLVPTQIFMMTAHPDFGKYDLSSLKLIWVGGAPLNFDQASEAEGKFGCRIVQGYGLVDAGGVAAGSPAESQKDRLCTVGKPLPGNELRFIDNDGNEVPEGEIQVRGPVFASGYYKDPQATASLWTKDGWYTTGDLGKFDSQGNLVIVGRKKDTIKRGGQNIFPVEVEDLLLTHPALSEVAIIGMPDPLMGERACAYVAPRKGMTFSFEEMASFLRDKNLAPFKLPERLEILEKLPIAGEQKVDKKALQKDIAQKLKDEGKIK